MASNICLCFFDLWKDQTGQDTEAGGAAEPLEVAPPNRCLHYEGIAFITPSPPSPHLQSLQSRVVGPPPTERCFTPAAF